MYDINAVAQEFNLSVDDIRTMLMDVRDDWDSTQTLTASEYELIKRSVNAPQLPQGNAITPVPDMEISQQQQLVQNASQVLGQQLLLSIQERVEIASILNDLTNQVILSNHNASIRDLASKLAQSDESVKGEYLQAIATLQSLVKASEPIPQRFDALSQAKAVAADMGKKMVH